MSIPNKKDKKQVDKSPSPRQSEKRSDIQKEGNDTSKVVNTEEQRSAVNQQDQDWKENTSSRETKNNKSDRSRENDSEGGSEVERPHRIEGDDAGSLERKIPNM